MPAGVKPAEGSQIGERAGPAAAAADFPLDFHFQHPELFTNYQSPRFRLPLHGRRESGADGKGCGVAGAVDRAGEGREQQKLRRCNPQGAKDLPAHRRRRPQGSQKRAPARVQLGSAVRQRLQGLHQTFFRLPVISPPPFRLIFAVFNSRFILSAFAPLPAPTLPLSHSPFPSTASALALFVIC